MSTNNLPEALRSMAQRIENEDSASAQSGRFYQSLIAKGIPQALAERMVEMEWAERLR